MNRLLYIQKLLFCIEMQTFFLLNVSQLFIWLRTCAVRHSSRPRTISLTCSSFSAYKRKLVVTSVLCLTAYSIAVDGHYTILKTVNFLTVSDPWNMCKTILKAQRSSSLMIPHGIDRLRLKGFFYEFIYRYAIFCIFHAFEM